MHNIRVIKLILPQPESVKIKMLTETTKKKKKKRNL